MAYLLYGDGIHDDQPAIQAMLDRGTSCVYLPPPEKNYVIGKPLLLHSNQELRLDRYTRICLADNSNCSMAENAEPETWNENITVCGGVWDMNHKNQDPNPYHYPNPKTGLILRQQYEKDGYTRERLFHPAYSGKCFRFNSIRGFHLHDLTIVNPVNFGVQMAYVEDFTVENLRFEYTEGSPKLWNMDGVHLEGGCRNGVVRNLQGACHDDLVAVTSDDGIYGPVENILIDGIYAEHSHSAVRLLSVRNPLRNVHITNVYGTYYVYCITLSKYHEGEERSRFENITIDHVYASLCKGTVDVKGNYEPLIAIGNHMDIKKLSLSHIYRQESVCPQPLIGLKEDCFVGELLLSDVEQVNLLGKEIPLIRNEGTIGTLHLTHVDGGEDPLLVGNAAERTVRH